MSSPNGVKILPPAINSLFLVAAGFTWSALGSLFLRFGCHFEVFFKIFTNFSPQLQNIRSDLWALIAQLTPTPESPFRFMGPHLLSSSHLKEYSWVLNCSAHPNSRITVRIHGPSMVQPTPTPESPFGFIGSHWFSPTQLLLNLD